MSDWIVNRLAKLPLLVLAATALLFAVLFAFAPFPLAVYSEASGLRWWILRWGLSLAFGFAALTCALKQSKRSDLKIWSDLSVGVTIAAYVAVLVAIEL